jgi:hypothetical protein
VVVVLAITSPLPLLLDIVAAMAFVIRVLHHDL